MSEIIITTGELENSCFVVMPFNQLYQTEYEKIIQPALEELNIKCVRGDEIYSKQRIMDDIWVNIRKCRFVIAELTGRNPNVLYEVGLAHAIGKPVIILTRNGDDVPFDLKDLRYLFYNTDDPYWGDNLKVAIKELIAKVVENPNIENYLEGINRVQKSEFPQINKYTEVKPILEVNISGTWIGSFTTSTKHDVVLEITQKDNELFAIAVISFDFESDPSIVQQNMTGFIENNKINLTGVNYTYVKRGYSEDYIMDKFNMTINKNNTILSGKLMEIDPNNLDGPVPIKLKRAKMKF